MYDITFSELLNEWLLSQKEMLKEGTYYSYKSRITSMIAPILGNKKINEMTGEDITNFTYELQQKGLSTKTVRLAITVVRNAVLFGVERHGMSTLCPTRLRCRNRKPLNVSRFPMRSSENS